MIAMRLVHRSYRVDEKKPRFFSGLFSKTVSMI